MVWLNTFMMSNLDVVEEHNFFVNQWLKNKSEHEFLVPLDSCMRKLVPILFVRWFQIRLTV